MTTTNAQRIVVRDLEEIGKFFEIREGVMMRLRENAKTNVRACHGFVTYHFTCHLMPEILGDDLSLKHLTILNTENRQKETL